MTIQAKAVDYCFRCGGAGRVYKTRKITETYILRYHQCEDCGRRFQTEEVRKLPKPAQAPLTPAK